MTPTSRMRAIAKLIISSPKNVLRWGKAFALHGYVGVKDRIYNDAIENEIAEWDDARPLQSGSIDGEVSFSVIIPVYNVDPRWLRMAIDSVEDQVYSNWELIIVDDGSTNESTKRFLNDLSKTNPKRIRILFSEENSGISSATNSACQIATGDYLAFLDNDDVLSPEALLECFYVAMKSSPDLMYSDQDEITATGKHQNPIFKPDWSPELLNSQMYIGHLMCVKRTVFEEVGGFNKEYDGSQDYDLALRISEVTAKFAHIPKILYSWRAIPTSTAADPNAKPYSQDAGLHAVQSHLDRSLGKGAASAEETDNHFVYDVKYAVPPNIKASIIIPTKDHSEDLRKLIQSITEQPPTLDYEIIILDNNSEQQETFDYFESLSGNDLIKVVEADYEFNWSKLNNEGMAHASGDVFVFLNNDMVVESNDWLYRLVGDALQDEIGVVGGLLLYPDRTIQHAGVVVGMNGWADHIYKGNLPIHAVSPFVSPVLKRNVSSVTGACMAISRKTIEAIGGFDEEFIVCGSDVELCLRALKHGYRNLFDPFVVLTHFESKTRNPSDIPDIDFKKSREKYAEIKALGDPYFNKNLDLNSSTPAQRKRGQRNAKAKLATFNPVGEIRPLRFRKSNRDEMRLNLMVPSINRNDVYGGISTAIRFFFELGTSLGCEMRIVVLDEEPNKHDIIEDLSDFQITKWSDEKPTNKQIVSMAGQRADKTLSVSKNDQFIFTIWWSAYCVQNEYANWNDLGLEPQKFIYLIQDYEPGFYPWSTRYMLADSTYRPEFKQIGIFNSKLLRDYFVDGGYTFSETFCFDPVLNPALNERLQSLGGKAPKRKKILIYGRPNTDRNAFEIIVEGLRMWIDSDPSSAAWDIVSAGEEFEPIYLGNGRCLSSLGKLTLGEYADVLSDSYIGISLMVSPHPSYPPLEMAAFGMHVITNSFGNKNLESFSVDGNIISLERLSPHTIAESISLLSKDYKPVMECGHVPREYTSSTREFPFIDELVKAL